MYNNSSTDTGPGITDGVTGIDKGLTIQQIDATMVNSTATIGSSMAEVMADFVTAAIAATEKAWPDLFERMAASDLDEAFERMAALEIEPPDQEAGFVCVHRGNDTWLPRKVYESRQRQQWRVSRAGQRAPWPGRRPKRGRDLHAGGSQFHNHRRRR